jgi:hypothetical protein
VRGYVKQSRGTKREGCINNAWYIFELPVTHWVEKQFSSEESNLPAISKGTEGSRFPSTGNSFEATRLCSGWCHGVRMDQSKLRYHST